MFHERGKRMPKITVFTPTYNRAYIIGKLYNSLQNQTISDFEWLVIDDGSTDNTQELFDAWIMDNNKFSIRYYRVKNGGKHRAINKATDLASGKLFFIVDSDDYLTNDALESVDNWERNLKGKHKFCGISGNRGKNENDIIGTTFNESYVDATSLERNKFNITGDKAEVFYTDILRRYKFDEIDGENFLTEATVWDRMAYDGYKIRWFNKTIYLCDYLEDGLTKNIKSIFARNPIGTAIYMKQQIKFYECGLIGKFSYYNLYYEFVKDELQISQIARYLEIQKLTLLAAISMVRCKKLIRPSG
jgi:glycosyltransferase involved in cell wall biosynthesis